MATTGLNETIVQEHELRMLLVEPQNLDAHWPLAVELLKRDPSDWAAMTMADIYIEIMRLRFQLWLFGDEFETYACMVTELRQYPRELIMNVIHASSLPSRDALDLLTFHELVEQWGWNQGATVIQIPCGRPGWKKVLREFDYEFAVIVLRKQLKPVKEH